MLRLDAPLPERPEALPERPETEPERPPALENDVRRDEGPEVSAPVGEADVRTGDVGLELPLPFVQTYCPFKSRFGISAARIS